MKRPSREEVAEECIGMGSRIHRYANKVSRIEDGVYMAEDGKLFHVREVPLEVDNVCRNNGNRVLSEEEVCLVKYANDEPFETIQHVCLATYLREKESLLNLVSGILGRVSLTLDLRTSSNQNQYVVCTIHFIADDWNLYRRILNVVDSDGHIRQAILTCLSNWHLDGRLLTLTLDHSLISLLDEAKIENLQGLLCVKNPHMLKGQLLVRNCYAHVVSQLAQDALGAMSETIAKIRTSIKYLKTILEE